MTLLSACEVCVEHEGNELEVKLKLLAQNFFTLVSLRLILPFIITRRDEPGQTISEVQGGGKKRHFTDPLRFVLCSYSERSNRWCCSRKQDGCSVHTSQQMPRPVYVAVVDTSLLAVGFSQRCCLSPSIFPVRRRSLLRLSHYDPSELR